MTLVKNQGGSVGVTELRRQETLLKQGLLQSAIFNSANFSSIATDAKGVIQIFNVGAERMLGYAAAEVMNKITPADISDPQEVIARAEALSVEIGTSITPGFEALVFKASRGIEDIYELTYIRKDGSRFPAVVSVTALRDAQDAIIGYLLIGTDNTARKQADDELQAAGQYARSLIEASLDPLVTISPDGKITDVNEGSVMVTGVSRGKLIGTDFSNYFTEPEKAREGYREAFSKGSVTDFPLTIRHVDGRLTDVLYNASVYKDAVGNVLGVFAAARDITARKRVEEEQKKLDQQLRDQQFYTRSLIESNIDALMTTNPSGIITDVNKQMEALTGCTRDELIGAPFKNYITEPARADAAIKRVLTENKVSNYELTVRSRNGEETVVSYNAATFHNRDRQLQGVFAAARDVTELKRFEHTLLEKNIELEHASRMKSAFLATMSHELRTPLNAIIGFSEALKDGLIGPMSDTQHDYIGDIFNSGQHLLSLINDILDLSKIEAGMLVLELESVDLKSLLSNSLSIVKGKAVAQRIQIEIDANDDLGQPPLDTRKTKQIVYNLLSNAVKFSAKDGCVTLRVRHVPRASVGTLLGAWPVHSFPLADNEYSEFLEICVSDNGIGISRENMAKLFKPFTQIDSSLARKFEGTGLGLAMVKQLAELHGGTVAVASAEGEGSSFAAWLPLRTAGEAATAGAASISENIALVVEDDDPKQSK